MNTAVKRGQKRVISIIFWPGKNLSPEVKMGQNIYPRKRRVLLLHSCEVLYLELIYISELHSSLQLGTSQLRGRG